MEVQQSSLHPPIYSCLKSSISRNYVCYLLPWLLTSWYSRWPVGSCVDMQSHHSFHSRRSQDRYLCLSERRGWVHQTRQIPQSWKGAICHPMSHGRGYERIALRLNPSYGWTQAMARAFKCQTNDRFLGSEILHVNFFLQNSQDTIPISTNFSTQLIPG